MSDSHQAPQAPEEAPIIVPWEQLSASALQGVIEEFVTREGTEYGARDVDLATKVAAVRKQLERGDVHVVFDAKSETVNLALVDQKRR